MSGRKDYSYVLEASRAARAAAERLRRRQEREAATRKRLREAEAEARARNDKLKAERQEANRRRLAKISRKTTETLRERGLSAKARLESLQAEGNANVKAKLEAAAAATREAINRSDTGSDKNCQTEQPDSNLDQIVESAAKLGVDSSVFVDFSEEMAEEDANERTMEESIGKLETACREQAELNEQIERQTDVMLQWQASLGRSEDVRDFASQSLEQWKKKVESITVELQEQRPNKETLSRVQAAILLAESIESDAGEVAEKYLARNQVMADIIDSLKEIGFFVQNPEFSDPDRPEGTVIIRANRGDQIMTAEVDLDKTVQSDWQGVHGAYCTDAFFDYVTAMGNRGIEITPDSPDLKPKLLEKDALDLPSNDQRSRGAQ
ncbi:hypothetical protein CKO51_27235 [Rhodopirellula sp. SM50]|nr:hypothetical protein [Rhodopirellula sp. SM50]PAY16349.1 hypothetical protein CKO51_27235 [Rhodopirellula sp. SM50]